MHEMSLAEGIVQLAEKTARREEARQIKRIFVDIGQLSCVEAEALKFCFEAVSRRTMAEGSQLEIRHIAGSALCPQCQRTVPIQALYDACPHCEAHPLQQLTGTEMRVREIEII